MQHIKNFLSKREQSQARLSFAKREKSRLLAKTILTLVLLLTVATGAWAESKPIGLNVEYAAGDEITSTTDVYVYYGDEPGTLKKMGVKITSTQPLTISMIIPDHIKLNGDVAVYYLPSGESTGGYGGGISCVGESTGDATVVHVASGSGTLADPYVFGSGPFGTPVPITWSATTPNTASIEAMPAGNVTVSVDYFAQAEFAMSTDPTPVALTAAPTAINDVPATTDGAIVNAGTVANIGSTTTAQGTVMYYAVQSATAPTAPDYDATGWTDKVPTATDFAEGNVYVWYYIKGAEPASGTDRTDANTCSDSEITALGTTGYVTLAAPPTYAITLKEGTEDVGEWTISPAEATKGTTITATYSGTKRVKSVKAVKKKAEPAAIINGKFSVSATKQVYFSKGNLRYASGAWSFFDNQYDYYATYSADAWDKFGWSNSTNNFGMSTSTENPVYQGDLVDWGTVPGIGTGWFTLSNSEWGYLFNTRSASTVNSVENARYAKGKVNGVYGIILFPDTYTHPAGVTLPVGINEVGNAGWNGNNYSAADWTAMETAGCVFLPATGYREGTSVQSAGSSCSYRSSSRNTSTTDMVNYVYFAEGSLTVSASNYGRYGQCVRLVQDVK